MVVVIVVVVVSVDLGGVFGSEEKGKSNLPSESACGDSRNGKFLFSLQFSCAKT